MDLTRRDFLRAMSAVAAALGVKGLDTFADETPGKLPGAAPVVWLEGQGCSGCSVSLLNSIFFNTTDDLLLNVLDVKFHATVMAAAGTRAIEAAQAAQGQEGYVLVVEGAVPTGDDGRYCYLWPGLTALQGVLDFAQNASTVLAVGSCSAFGGVAAGSPNPTGVQPVSEILNTSLPDKLVINIPGCPSHPDWVVGTIAHLITYGTAPTLDSQLRPRDFFQNKIHRECPNFDDYTAGNFGLDACLLELGCKGRNARGDCATRKWNSPAKAQPGVNWCIGARSGCIGCTEPGFPDGMSPFYESSGPAAAGEGGGAPSKPDAKLDVTVSDAQEESSATGESNDRTDQRLPTRTLTQYEKRRRYLEQRAKARAAQQRAARQRLEAERRMAGPRQLEYE